MIDKNFFINNRTRLLGSLDNTNVVAVTGYTGMQSSADVAAPFQQESNFWYLTGINEPDWWLIIADGVSWLVAPDIPESHRIFEGGLSADEARAVSGVDKIIDESTAHELLERLAKKHSVVGSLGEDPYASYYRFSMNPAPTEMWHRLGSLFSEVYDIRLSLTKLRAIKQPSEIRMIEQAVDLTVRTFEQAKASLPTVSHEYELEAIFSAEFRRHNATHAYEPIVADGGNACTLHYVKNSDKLRDSSLVLIDIGARVGAYAADITRTYAIGESTQRQMRIHQVLQRAQQKIINFLNPGLSFSEYYDHADAVIEQALRELDLFKHSDDLRRYLPHSIGHGLGIDVHDSLSGYDEFQPGMVLTVEPGIYIPDEKIGVRLEDNILITKTGHKNMSGALSLDV